MDGEGTMSPSVKKRGAGPGGSRKGIPNHTTAKIRHVITQAVGSNSGKISRWLSEIEATEGPRVALEAFCRVAQLALPRQSDIAVTATTQINILAILDEARGRLVGAGIVAETPRLQGPDTGNGYYVNSPRPEFVVNQPQLERDLAQAYDDPGEEFGDSD